MKVLDEAMDQCLLCIDYAFDQDSPSNREVSLRRLQPGVRQKEWWRYGHIYRGLRTLVAYEGARAAGHIEFMPIEHVPRPVTGHNLAFVNCICVAPEARGRGVGHGLLQAAELEARKHADGMAVLARRIGPILPIGFFTTHGYRPVEGREGEMLLHKPFHDAPSPRLLPVRYQPRRLEGRIAVDFFHCSQCPHSGWVLDRLRKGGQLSSPEVDLRVIDASEREAVVLWGVANAVYIDGHPCGQVPLDLPTIEKGLAQARASLRPA